MVNNSSKQKAGLLIFQSVIQLLERYPVDPRVLREFELYRLRG